MRNENNLYHNIEKYMIRAPFFSVEDYRRFLSENTENDNIDKFIIELCNNAVFREAILAASENLHSKIDDYISGKMSETKKRNDFRLSILKYYIRMSSRTTPFGLFSFVGMGEVGEKNTDKKICLGKNNKKARPDFEWLMKVVKDYEEKYRKYVQYITNAIVTEKGDRINLPYNTGGTDEEISLRNSKPVQILVELCKGEYKSYEEMIDALKKEYPTVSDEKIEAIIKELIEKEVVISNLRPSLTSDDQMVYVINQLKNVKAAEKELVELEKINSDINTYNQLMIGEGENLLAKILREMKDMMESSSYLQIDTMTEIDNNSIKGIDGKELNDYADFFFAFSQNKEKKNNIYDEYRIDFIEKYGEDREVLLTEMLDNDFGVGAPYSYMHPTASRGRMGVQNEDDEMCSEYFLRKLQESCKNNEPINIEEDFVEKLMEHEKILIKDLPLSLELNFMCKENEGQMLYYLGPNVGSTGAGKTFGRFTHIVQDYRELCDQIDEEENKLIYDNTIICELSYIPQKVRYANVTRNYNNRAYEMSFFYRDINSEKQFISIDDIYVGIENNRFYLKSRKLNKRVIFKTNNMLNIMGDANIIRFLKEIEQDEYVEWNDFPWKRLFKNLTYVPEIRYRNLILSTEMWRMKKEDIAENNKYEDFEEGLSNYINKYNVPQFVYVSESDNRLLLDLQNQWCRKILYKIIKTEKNIILNAVEKGNELIEDKGEKLHNCEIVVPYIRNNFNDESITNSVQEVNASGVKTQKILDVAMDYRYKMLGSDWFYVKIYGVDAWQENIIIYYISQFADVLLQEGIIDKYFFMRYTDPQFHIRLRFHGKDISNNSEKIIKWLNQMFAEKIISHFEIGCYEREIERYGGVHGIEIAEDIFYIDSRVTEKLLLLMKDKEISFEKELIGVISAIFYMKQFGWSFSRQLEWLNSFIGKDDYKSEHKKVRKEYEEICNDRNEWYSLVHKDGGKELHDLFSAREGFVNKYRQAIQKNKITTSEETIVGSLIHLSFNRLFGIDREFEKKIMSLTRHTLYSLKYIKQKENAIE
ncbi:MAG: lantibiotic dehydratase [Lachnospiraceae bacterium]|nr:lantibiotic dehydratase [Lachnospiraceae bacterium]